MSIDSILSLLRKGQIQIINPENPKTTMEKVKQISKIAWNIIFGILGLMTSMVIVAFPDFFLITEIRPYYFFDLFSKTFLIYFFVKESFTHLTEAINHAQDLYDNWKEHKVVKA